MLLVCLVSPLWAQGETVYSDQWLKDPYDLRIVIHAEPHPLLTNFFVEQFTKNLTDCMQRDLGGTCKVNSVIFREDVDSSSDPARALMALVLREDWSALESSGPNRGQIGQPKVHLVRLLYQDGQYEVQSRQVDGDTGIVSPLRRSVTTDRQFISRLACMQVAQDFGQTGSIDETINQTIRIQMRATGLGQTQTIHMHQGEVMAVAVVRQTTTGFTAYRLPETLAYITNVDAARGRVTARIYSRDKDVLRRDSQTMGFRVLKLGTLRTPLQLKVVDKENNPIAGYSVSLYPSGYENPSVEALGTTDAQGRIFTKDPVNHVAFVRVQIAGVGKADAPVALIDDQPVVVTISGNAQAKQLDDTKFEFDQWHKKYRAIRDDWEVTIPISAKMASDGNVRGSRDLRLKLAERLKTGAAELDKMVQEIKNAAGDLAANLAKNYIETATEKTKEVADGAAELVETVKLEENPTPAMIAMMKGKEAEKNFDYDAALKHYKESVRLDGKQEKLKNKIKSLERAWAIQPGDKVHTDARQFASKTWYNKSKPMNWEDIGKEIGNAERCLDDLEQRGDYLTVTIMREGNLQHVRTLNNARDTLGNSEEAQEKQAQIEKTKKDLIDFEKKCADFVNKTLNELNK
jgi:hypothetical protein